MTIRPNANDDIPNSTKANQKECQEDKGSHEFLYSTCDPVVHLVLINVFFRKINILILIGIVSHTLRI